MTCGVTKPLRNLLPSLCFLVCAVKLGRLVVEDFNVLLDEDNGEAREGAEELVEDAMLPARCKQTWVSRPFSVDEALH